ncbi:MAG: DUF4153 domain-containing protein [Alloprevotella sp.]|nr:DUF4153 domain-containing protein [Alloprevotella sp.]
MINQVLSDAYNNCVKRFLLPTIFVVLSALFMLYCIYGGKTTDVVTISASVFLSLGGLFSLAFSLWKEDGTKPVLAWSVYIIALAGIIVDALYLYTSLQPTEFGCQEIILGHLAVYVTLLVVIWVLPFLRSKDDVPVWNFGLRLLVSWMVCQIIGMILIGGISMLWVALQGLFGFALGGSKGIESIYVLFGFLFPLLLFLGLIPAGERKHDYTLRGTGFLRKIVLYIFLPLEALYLLVLYVYALKILLTWQLPDGMVSWLVIVAFVGCVGIEVLLYPSRKKYNHRFDNLVAQYLPLILLPLLLLMTVGICRRFSDYGITVARLYLALLNAWFYIVCLWLHISRARHFRFIPVTFAVLLLFSSVFPVNFTSLTRNSLVRTIHNTFLNNGAKQLPIELSQFDRLMCSMPKAEAKSVVEKMDYLRETMGEDVLGELVETDGKPMDLLEHMITYRRDVNTTVDVRYYGYITDKNIIIPTDSKDFSAVWVSEPNSKAYEGVETLLPVRVGDIVVDSVGVDIAILKRLTENFDKPVAFETKSANRTLVVTDFDVSANPEPDTYNFTLSGYLFSK